MEQAKSYVVELLSKQDQSQVNVEEASVHSDHLKMVLTFCKHLCTAATRIPLCEVGLIL